MSTELQQKWDERYQNIQIGVNPAAQVLIENQHLLPTTGLALDLACGSGANAILLARRGLQTHAWDLSPTVIEKVNQYATRHKLDIHAAVHDVTVTSLTPESLDVIVVSHFLERSLCPAITKALKPGGLLFYQTFIRDRVDTTGPGNPEFRLASNELLRLFEGLRVLVYREEGTVGDQTRGFRNEAWLVGMQGGDKIQR